MIQNMGGGGGGSLPINQINIEPTGPPSDDCVLPQSSPVNP